MKTKRLKSLVNLGLLLAFPLLILLSIGWILIPHNSDYLREVIAFGLLTSIGYFFLFLFHSKKVRAVVFYCFYFLLSVLIVIKLSFYYHYNVKLSASALYVIFETNGVEARDFLSQFLDSKVLLLVGLVALPYVFYILNTNFKNWVNAVIANDFLLKPVVLNAIPLVVIAFSIYQIELRFQAYNLLTTTYNSYKDYRVTKTLLKESLSKPESKYVQVENQAEAPQTHVVIIGESTSKWHMQLYGYERETNPELSKLKDELLIFKDVITTNTHTILALDKILTFSEFSEPNKKDNTSIIQLANQAEFTTYWLSNQRPIGMHEAVSTQIGTAADYEYFMTTENTNDATLDEKLLPQLDSILKDAESKRIIFIHLAGTHSVYDNHYPENYAHFKGKITSKTTHQSNIINTYDNAIRYNDFIVSEIIKKIKALDTNSYVVYFSDHGDEVYDTIDFAGHSEYHATAPMYDVPFVVWLSKTYKKENDTDSMQNYTNRKYILEDFPYSFSELSTIKFEGFEASKSIFNAQFVEKPRLIKQGEDYDKR
ncbi:sulfatase-like hydrolase/transferase [Lacinutrix salivirga]